MDKIRQYSAEEVLYSFWNKHLDAYMAAKINVLLGKKKVAEDPEKVVGYETLPPMGRNMPPSVRDLRAKDYLKKFEAQLKQQKDLLDVIKELIESKNYGL